MLNTVVYEENNFDLPGGTVIALLQAVLRPTVEDWYVMIGEIDGAIKVPGFAFDGNRYWVPEFLRDCAQVVQFDWGDFYLFSDKKTLIETEYRPRDYLTILQSADFLMRAVDHSYVYLHSLKHGPDVLQSFPVKWTEFQTDEPDKFVFPQ